MDESGQAFAGGGGPEMQRNPGFRMCEDGVLQSRLSGFCDGAAAETLIGVPVGAVRR